MSSKLETKLEFDRQLLLDVGIFDKDNNGFMTVDLAGTPTPVTIGGKRLVLTTKELLREGEWEDRIAFHPLSEQITQGPSAVLNALKNYIGERAKETLIAIIDALGELATDVKRQKPLSAKAAKYLSLFNGQEFDATTLKTLRAVLKATSNVPEKRFLNIFLQNGGEKGYLRTCQIAFPFMEDDDASDTTTYFGVKMPRKTKDKALIIALLEYVLGNEEERKTLYTRGVKDGDAPYLHSLLLSFKALADRINDLIEIHGKACQNLKPLKLDLLWAAELENFDEFVRTYGVSVPALPGNVGVEDDELGVEEEKPEPKSSVFTSDEEDVGGKVDVPWDEDDRRPSSRERDRDRKEDRRERDYDDRRDERRGGKSMADLLNRRRGEENDRGRERERDRDDRRSPFRDRERSGRRSDW